jgi:hypothetical protein
MFKSMIIAAVAAASLLAAASAFAATPSFSVSTQSRNTLGVNAELVAYRSYRRDYRPDYYSSCVYRNKYCPPASFQDQPFAFEHKRLRTSHLFSRATKYALGQSFGRSFDHPFGR